MFTMESLSVRFSIHKKSGVRVGQHEHLIWRWGYLLIDELHFCRELNASQLTRYNLLYHHETASANHIIARFH